MFIWTISDVIGVIVAITIVLSWHALSFLRWKRTARCKHDGGVNETQACDAICRKCGKNMGFIGTWREKHTVPNVKVTGAPNAGMGVTEQRKAIAAAVKTEDGLVHFMPPPHRHHHTVHALHRDNGELIIARGEQGFVMSDGTFASREEAGRCAIVAGQISELAHPPRLYSEDLW